MARCAAKKSEKNFRYPLANARELCYTIKVKERQS